MARLIFLFIFSVIITTGSNAQWYNRSCGVTDLNEYTLEEYLCMWEKSTKMFRNGIIGTSVGFTLMAGGVIIFIAGKDEYQEWSERMVETLFYPIPYLLFAAGIITEIISIPILVVGAHRRSNLKESYNYNKLISGNVYVTPNLNIGQINNAKYLNFGLSVRF